MENGQVKNLPYVEQVFSLLVVYRFIAKRAHERSWIRQNAEANRYMPDFVSHVGLASILKTQTESVVSFFAHRLRSQKNAFLEFVLHNRSLKREPTTAQAIVIPRKP